jgi:polyhydroxyalkanoate synthesis regulator phasin
MDKKAKKKLDVIHQRMQIVQQQLAGARKQNDTPGEVQRLETELTRLEAEAKSLKER